MEYSPMMVVILWALTPSDCLPTGSGGEPARVVEMPQPIMSVHPEGYFTFNHGRPFLAERDPLTGAIDSNIKTTPVTSDDYLYEEYEEPGETIDRKDSTKIYTRNDITSSSKESDLHKFLNLPVHYSSSGKFPLISSSYANTKVQGHGPLSNHKLYTSSTSTTSTVSPSYYPLKTTLSTTIIANITTTRIPTSTTTTTTLSPTKKSTTVSTTTTEKASPRSTTKLTTTSKPLLPNYEYEYDYDYDKNEGEITEKTSHDYEFLGASSEVTKFYDKSPTTINPIKPNGPLLPITDSIKLPTSATSSTTTLSTTTNKAVTDLKSTIHPSTSEVKPTLPVKSEGHHNTSKFPHVEDTTIHQDETIDLKPPKPELPVDLRPPQVYPSRPYSSVVPTKTQNFGHSGFVRYPDSPLIVADKKPFNVYSLQNISETKPDVIPPISLTSKPNSRPQEETQNSTTESRPLVVQLTSNNPQNKNTTEANVLSSNTENLKTQLEAILGLDSLFKYPSVQNKNNSISSKDKTHEIHSNNNSKPFSSLPFVNPLEKYKDPVDVNKPKLRPTSDHRKPENITEHIHGEQLTEHSNHQVVLKPEYRPHDVSSLEYSKLQGMHSSILHRPQEQKPQIPVQGHTKPTIVLHEHNKYQGGAPSSEAKRPQIPENSRLQANVKLDNNRPYIGQNNKSPLHYPSNQNRPPNYQMPDINYPQNYFGLRITERPYISDRVPGMEQLRPHNTGKPQIIAHDTKKPSSGAEGIPHQGIISEVRPADSSHRPESNIKPVIFSKPQSGKRPDYNTVQFGQPSKVENHYISVSPGHDNPSYSLQTSFSIGVPPSEQKQTPSGGNLGIGQVLFPDEEPEKRLPIWSHQRPPSQGSQSDTHPNIQVEKYPRPPWESHLKPPHTYKKEPYLPIKRKPLPNILPQFRPNAKIGHAEPHIYLKPREPYDTLQPPPLPRPQFLRLEQDIEESKPLVHRRNGQTSNRVTTLQMMQSSPATKRATLRTDDNNEKNEPVFVVYPSNGNTASSPPSDAVVVGTRGSQRPLPPDNLDIGDDLDSFPLDSNKNFQARVDTPVLKSKSPTTKPVVKNDFPYTLIKPIPDDKITPGSVVTNEYTAFSPTVPSIEKYHDTEINIIPYLQDYMPFATKKPSHKDSWLLGTDVKHHASTIISKLSGTEMTPTPHKNDNHRIVSEGPQPQDFQAPFHASLTAPSQGWSVIQKKSSKEKSNAEVTTIKELNDVQTTEESKFDIQNFKPQLFGGFKPIVPSVENENKEKSYI